MGTSLLYETPVASKSEQLPGGKISLFKISYYRQWMNPMWKRWLQGKCKVKPSCSSVLEEYCNASSFYFVVVIELGWKIWDAGIIAMFAFSLFPSWQPARSRLHSLSHALAWAFPSHSFLLCLSASFSQTPPYSCPPLFSSLLEVIFLKIWLFLCEFSLCCVFFFFSQFPLNSYAIHKSKLTSYAFLPYALLQIYIQIYAYTPFWNEWGGTLYLIQIWSFRVDEFLPVRQPFVVLCWLIYTIVKIDFWKK